MICWLTDEGWETTLVLAVIQMGCWLVSELMLVSEPSVSVDNCEMSLAETALALAPLCDT